MLQLLYVYEKTHPQRTESLTVALQVDFRRLDASIDMGLMRNSVKHFNSIMKFQEIPILKYFGT